MDRVSETLPDLAETRAHLAQLIASYDVSFAAAQDGDEDQALRLFSTVVRLRCEAERQFECEFVPLTAMDADLKRAFRELADLLRTLKTGAT